MPEVIVSQYDRKYALPIETFRQVQNINDRDNVPSGIRWDGMMVYVVSEQITYQLTGGVTNDKWANVGDFSDIVVRDNLTSTSITDALSANQGRVLDLKFSGYLPLTAKAADSNLLDGLDSTAFQLVSLKGAVNGYAGLDATGKVPAAQLPAFVDDVLEFPNLAAFPATGSAGVLYVALDTNFIYRWSGSTYIQIGGGGAGAVDSVFGRLGAIVAQVGDYSSFYLGIGATSVNSNLLEGKDRNYYAGYNTQTLGNNVDFNALVYDFTDAYTTQSVQVPNFTGQTNFPFNGYGQLMTFNSANGLFPIQIAASDNGALAIRTQYQPTVTGSMTAAWGQVYNSNVDLALPVNRKINFNGKSELFGGTVATAFNLLTADLLIQDNDVTRFTFARAGSFSNTGDISTGGNLVVQRTTSYNASADTLFILGGTDNGYVNNGVASHYRTSVQGSAANQILYFDPFIRGTGYVDGFRYDGTNKILQNAGQIVSVKNNVVNNNLYGNGNIEVRTTDNSSPSIGFHKAGFDAAALYYSGGADFRVRSVGGVDKGIPLLDYANGGSFTTTGNLTQQDGAGSSVQISFTNNLGGFGSANDFGIALLHGCRRDNNALGENVFNITNTFIGGAGIAVRNTGNNVHQPYFLTSAPLGGTSGEGNIALTSYTIWHSGNDGIGSGLDADLLDGVQLASSSGLGQVWGYVPRVNTNGVMEVGRYIDFHSTSNSGVDNTFRIDNTASGNLTCSGTLTATNFNLSSDKTLKKNIKPYKPKAINVDWVNFEWKDKNAGKGFQLGLIAQQLEKNHPEFVYTDSNGIKSVGYIQVLVAKIVELEMRIKNLE
jgi:hypothetical protein